MSWRVETTTEFDEWFATLAEQEEDQVVSAIGALEIEGPNLGRPLVDTVKASKHPNMNEYAGDRSESCSPSTPSGLRCC